MGNSANDLVCLNNNSLELTLTVFFFFQQALERAGVRTANENKDMTKTSRSNSVRSVDVTLEAADAGQHVDLTVRQLLVRRGLSLLLMVLVLAAAVSLAELLPA